MVSIDVPIQMMVDSFDIYFKKNRICLKIINREEFAVAETPLPY